MSNAQTAEDVFGGRGGEGHDAILDASLGLSRAADPDYRPPVYDAGTRVTLAINGFEFVPETTDGDRTIKAYIKGLFEYLEPTDRLGDSFTQNFSVNFTPKDDKRPQNTGMAMSFNIFQRIIAAVLGKPLKSPDVQEWHAGMGMYKADIIGAYVPELVSRLNATCTGKSIETDLGVGKSLRGALFNELGTPVYPDPEQKRPRPRNEGAAK